MPNIDSKEIYSKLQNFYSLSESEQEDIFRLLPDVCASGEEILCSFVPKDAVDLDLGVLPDSLELVDGATPRINELYEGAEPTEEEIFRFRSLLELEFIEKNPFETVVYTYEVNAGEESLFVVVTTQ